jgi:hypothetical protein
VLGCVPGAWARVRGAQVARSGCGLGFRFRTVQIMRRPWHVFWQGVIGDRGVTFVLRRARVMELILVARPKGEQWRVNSLARDGARTRDGAPPKTPAMRHRRESGHDCSPSSPSASRTGTGAATLRRSAPGRTGREAPGENGAASGRDRSDGVAPGWVLDRLDGARTRGRVQVRDDPASPAPSPSSRPPALRRSSGETTSTKRGA